MYVFYRDKEADNLYDKLVIFAFRKRKFYRIDKLSQDQCTLRISVQNLKLYRRGANCFVKRLDAVEPLHRRIY